MANSTTLPPPLSDAPSVETLERLLVGLHQPVQRGVPSPPGPPSPPSPDQPLAVSMFAPETPVPDAAATEIPVTEDSATEPSAPPAPDPAGLPSLSWSAHGRRGRWTPTTTAIGLAVVTAAGVVAGLVAAGELSLP